jgi:formylglycine-generating enzyme required for sulfatase activity
MKVQAKRRLRIERLLAPAALLGLWLAAAPARAAEPRPEMVLDLGDNITMKLVQIPAGKFLMGSPANEQGRNADEGVAPADAKDGKTQVEVTISKPFYMGVYEVTVDQYKQFSPKNDKRGNIMTWGPGSPEYHQRGGIPFFNWSFEKKEVKSEQNGSHPALATLPEDAQKFCEWLSEKTGKKVRLPTEAQWEYACRAGSTTRFSFGDKDEDLCRYANYCDQSNTCAFPWQDKAHRDGFDKTSPVGSFKPNAWGLYDMHGNAWELCRGWYTQNYPAADTVDPKGPATGDRFVLRGGGWDSTPALCRSAVREKRDSWNDPHARSDIDGFRVIVEEEVQEQAAKGAAAQEQAGKPAVANEQTAAQSPAAAVASVLPELVLDLGDNVTVKLVKIPAGKFMMGQALGEKSLTWNDKTYRFEEATNTKPQTEVTVGSFYMGVHEVTRRQYGQFTKPPANYPYFKQDNDDHPLLTSTIEDCGKFCAWLSKKTGKDVRLPTEAQWEYACRAGSTTRYYFGDDLAELHKYANYCDAACSRAYRHRDRQHNDGWDMTAPVGSLKPNAWGLYDMLGNVQEMCFHEGETAATLAATLAGPEADLKKTRWPIRGGSWNSGWGDGWGECASATRSTVGSKWMHSFNEGFRVAIPIDPKTGEAALAPAAPAAGGATVKE